MKQTQIMLSISIRNVAIISQDHVFILVLLFTLVVISAVVCSMEMLSHSELWA